MNKTVTCPERQFELFSSSWLEGLILVAYHQIQDQIQEHKLSVLTMMLVWDRMNGLYKEVKYILPV